MPDDLRVVRIDRYSPHGVELVISYNRKVTEDELRLLRDMLVRVNEGLDGLAKSLVAHDHGVSGDLDYVRIEGKGVDALERRELDRSQVGVTRIPITRPIAGSAEAVRLTDRLIAAERAGSAAELEQARLEIAQWAVAYRSGYERMVARIPPHHEGFSKDHGGY